MVSNFEFSITGRSLRGEQTASVEREMEKLVVTEDNRTLLRTRRMAFGTSYLVEVQRPPHTRWWGWRGEGG